jgi:signal transduction histidine kinase
VIEQMRDGVVVLDTRGCVLDLNPTATRILGLTLPRARGSALPEALAAGPDQPSGISSRVGGQTRHYLPLRSVLTDRRGSPIGEFLLLHDVTEQKQAEKELLEKQRSIATMLERERVARELHDSLGQVLGYVKIQGHIAREFMAQGDSARADGCLAQLVAAAEAAHEDVRDYIVGARTGKADGTTFHHLLENYLRRFTESSGIHTRLAAAPELEGSVLEPMVETQMLRIIQEALTNVRKHAGANSVEIRLTLSEGQMEAVIQDNGAGFEAALVESAPGRRFGLSVMHERAEEVGGAVKVESSPGLGTRIVVCVPRGQRAT